MSQRLTSGQKIVRQARMYSSLQDSNSGIAALMVAQKNSDSFSPQEYLQSLARSIMAQSNSIGNYMLDGSNVTTSQPVVVAMQACDKTFLQTREVTKMTEAFARKTTMIVAAGYAAGMKDQQIFRRPKDSEAGEKAYLERRGKSNDSDVLKAYVDNIQKFINKNMADAKPHTKRRFEQASSYLSSVSHYVTQMPSDPSQAEQQDMRLWGETVSSPEVGRDQGNATQANYVMNEITEVEKNFQEAMQNLKKALDTPGLTTMPADPPYLTLLSDIGASKPFLNIDVKGMSYEQRAEAIADMFLDDDRFNVQLGNLKQAGIGIMPFNNVMEKFKVDAVAEIKELPEDKKMPLADESKRLFGQDNYVAGLSMAASKPAQLLMRYPMLLTELTKRLPKGSPAAVKVQQAVIKTQILAQQANQEARMSSTRELEQSISAGIGNIKGKGETKNALVSELKKPDLSIEAKAKCLSTYIDAKKSRKKDPVLMGLSDKYQRLIDSVNESEVSASNLRSLHLNLEELRQPKKPTHTPPLPPLPASMAAEDKASPPLPPVPASMAAEDKAPPPLPPVPASMEAENKVVGLREFIAKIREKNGSLPPSLVQLNLELNVDRPDAEKWEQASKWADKQKAPPSSQSRMLARAAVNPAAVVKEFIGVKNKMAEVQAVVDKVVKSQSEKVEVSARVPSTPRNRS